MSYRDCLGCEKAGTKPKRGKGIRLVFDPQITMPGPPTIEGHRLSAEFMARRVRVCGITEEMDDYQLTREELLVVCWWAGEFGSRRLRKCWGGWAQIAHQHLWHGCINIPDPPMETVSASASTGKETGE